MALGFAKSKADWDNRAGSLAMTLRDTLSAIQRFQVLLAATLDTDLQALGYSAGEVATLKSAYTDLNKLATIYLGTQTQATTYDFTQFAKQLTGVV